MIDLLWIEEVAMTNLFPLSGAGWDFELVEVATTPANPLLLILLILCSLMKLYDIDQGLRVGYNLIFGKQASVVLIFLIVDKVSPEEGTGVEQLIQLPIKGNIICRIIWQKNYILML